MNKLSILRIQQVSTNRGVRSTSLIYNDRTSFCITPGYIHIQTSTSSNIYSVNNTLIKSVSGLSANTQYIVYVKIPTTGNIVSSSDIEYSTIIPALDPNKNGWYHPTNTSQRAIGFIRSQAGSLIMPFKQTSKYYVYEDFGGLLVQGDTNLYREYNYGGPAFSNIRINVYLLCYVQVYGSIYDFAPKVGCPNEYSTSLCQLNTANLYQTVEASILTSTSGQCNIGAEKRFYSSVDFKGFDLPVGF